MTLDRDVRITPDELTATANALRKRARQLERSIATATAAARAGHRIQHGTHDRNVRELETVRGMLEKLEAARKQIAHQISAKLGLEG